MLFGKMSSAAYMNLLYWDNLHMGFGHVAVQVFEYDDQEQPSFYISFATGNSYQWDLANHGKNPLTARLPPLEWHAFNRFKDWYSKSIYSAPNLPEYVDTYRLFTNNCAHVAAKMINEFGYQIPFRFNIFPYSVYLYAKTFQMS